MLGLTDVSAGVVEPLVHEMAAVRGIKLGAIAQPLRVALTGGTASPGIFEVIEIMGQGACPAETERGGRGMISAILVCPQCKGKVYSTEKGDGFTCSSCGLFYRCAMASLSCW